MRIAKWDTFQGYQKTGPKWIKLHAGLIDKPEWMHLPTVAKAVLPALWIAASRSGSDGKLPDDIETLSMLCHMRQSEVSDAIEPLVSAGFIECDETLARSATKPSQGLREKNGLVEGEESRGRVEGEESLNHGLVAAPTEEQQPGTALERAAAPDPFDEKPDERKRAITELGALCTQVAAKERKEVREVLIENSRTPSGAIITNPSSVSLDWICATIAKLKARGQPILSDNYRRTAEAAARVLVQLKAEQASEPLREIRR